MKYWLDIPCKELSDKLLLDEHRSVHAYFGGMLKDPVKWSRHKLIGPMDACVLYERHIEEVEEMARRGWKHKTPVTCEEYCTVDKWRVELRGLGFGEMYRDGTIIRVSEQVKLQEEYMRRRGIERRCKE